MVGVPVLNKKDKLRKRFDISIRWCDIGEVGKRTGDVYLVYLGEAKRVKYGGGPFTLPNLPYILVRHPRQSLGNLSVCLCHTRVTPKSRGNRARI